MPSSEPWVLAIGGTDSSGGAGLDADRDAADLRLEVVVTAATEQSDEQVFALGERDPDTWLFEALSSMAVDNPGAIKFGLLPGAEHVRAALSVIDQVRFEDPSLPIVVDPVLASSSGGAFLAPSDAALLLTRQVILTPNLPEAAALMGAPLALLQADHGARLAAAATLLSRGLAAVVLKGGHASEERCSDLLLAQGQAPVWHRHPRQAGAGIRGSGCRFATALACQLARGAALPQALPAAAALVAARIADQSARVADKRQ